MCPNSNNQIRQTDFACIGDVATHCDNKKMCVAIDESRIFDMAQLFCDEWGEILTIIKEVRDYQDAYAAYLTALAECEADPDCTTPPSAPIEPPNYDEKVNLVCGGDFVGCGGKTLTHLGALRIWVYYAYARYVIINPYSDTANGLVTKTNEFSIPTPLKEFQQISDRYRTMGFDAYKMTAQFIKNGDIVASDVCYCGKCGGTKAKGYGIKSGIIRKKL